MAVTVPRAMVSAAFPELEAAERDALIPEFLQRYEASIGQHAVLFDGVAGMLDVSGQSAVRIDSKLIQALRADPAVRTLKVRYSPPWAS